MTDGRQPLRGLAPIRFPLTVPKQGAGETPPPAGSQFAGQIRTFIGISGYVDGLYICDTNLAGTWGWFKIHGHGQPLNAQSFTGGVSVSGNVGASTFSGGSATIGVISGGSVVGATAGSFTNLTVGGSSVRGVIKVSRTYDAPSIAAGGQHSFTITATGAASTDGVLVTGDGMSLGLVAYGIVSPTNTVTVTLCNFSAVAVDPTSQTYYAYVIRS